MLKLIFLISYIKNREEVPGVEPELLKEMQTYLDTLRERSKRKVLRLINKGTLFNYKISFYKSIT